MWYLVYTSGPQAKRLESLISAINAKNYNKCKKVVYESVITELQHDAHNVKYMELETKKEETQVVNNWGVKEFPALVHTIPGQPVITKIYYEQDFLSDTFSFPRL